MKPSRLLVVAAACLFAACSSPAQEAGPAPSPSPPATVSSSFAAPTTSSMPSPTSDAPPVLADLPAEGRDLASCKDGQCRVTVRTGDRIEVPPDTGGSLIEITAISPAEVSIEMPGPDGSNSTITFFAPGPTGLGEERFSVAFLDLRDGEATMQVDV